MKDDMFAECFNFKVSMSNAIFAKDGTAEVAKQRSETIADADKVRALRAPLSLALALSKLPDISSWLGWERWRRSPRTFDRAYAIC